MPFQNAGGVAAAAAVLHARPVYPRDTRRETTEIISQKHIRRMYRKRQTAYCNATDVRVSGTWPPIAGTCRAASDAASRTALSFAQGRGTTLYVATALGPITPVNLFLCRESYRLSPISHQYSLCLINITSHRYPLCISIIKVDEQGNISYVMSLYQKMYTSYTFKYIFCIWYNRTSLAIHE